MHESILEGNFTNNFLDGFFFSHVPSDKLSEDFHWEA